MFTRRIDEDLELELLHVGLAVPLFKAVDASRAELRQWMIWVDDTRQILDTREFLRLSMAGWAEGRMVRCAIRFRGEVCGSVSIEGIDATMGCGEMGYWLATKFVGRGIVTRCVANLTKLAFDELDLHRVEIYAAEANTRSWAIPVRLGWTYEGTRRQSVVLNGERLDMRSYSLLRTDAGTSSK